MDSEVDMQTISGKQARELVASGARLIDVRSPAEFSQNALPGAVNIPLHLLPLQAGELEPDAPLVLYCASGGRSYQATTLLSGLGFGRVFNLGSAQRFHDPE